LSLPMYPGLSNAQIHEVVDSLKSLLETRATAVIPG
jgi:dTDP-4-amino-4,6-dideoxygalactose transaminase